VKEADPAYRYSFLVIGLIFVGTFNKIFTALLAQHSHWRIDHSLAGLIFLIIYAGLVLEGAHTRKRLQRFVLVAIIPTYIGTVFPDLDITVLGIGGHRNPLFHSCLTYWVLAGALLGKGTEMRYITIGYGLGLSSHLFIDAFDRAAIRWLPGGHFIDQIWLVGNSLLCLVFPPGTQRRALPHTSSIERQ